MLAVNDLNEKQLVEFTSISQGKINQYNSVDANLFIKYLFRWRYV